MPLIKPILLGIVIAAPIGPMAILCINRTINKGRNAGLMIGLGIASGDLIYAFCAVFLYSYVSLFLYKYNTTISLMGALVLLILGISFLIKKNNLNNLSSPSKNYLSTVLLTLSNPTTILSFAAIVATIPTKNPWLTAIGIFLGSLIWWIFIVFTISLIKHKFSQNTIKFINIASALFIILFAFVHLIRLLQ